MIEEIKKILITNNLILTAAESCTGGLLSSYLTDISGSSSYIKQNFVTYANEAKVSILDVKPETIEKYGAVSEQTAKEMVQGLIKRGFGDIAISTTGIADKNGEGNKPAGLVYIGIGNKRKIKAIRFQIPFISRIETKKSFVNKALSELLQFLRENYPFV